MNLKPINDLLINAASKAVTNAVSKSAVNSKEHKAEDDIKIYKMNKLYGIIGSIGLIIAIGCALIPVSEDFNLTGKLILMGIFGLLGLAIVAGYLVSRVITDLEKITYINMLGIKRSIYWMDLKHVYTIPGEDDIYISSESRKIKISPYFNGFKELNEILVKKREYFKL